MRIISHRGNLNGIDKSKENDPDHIYHVLTSTKFDVEIDVFGVNDDLYFGHDEPKYKMPNDFLWGHQNRIWIHCKNLRSLHLMCVFYFDDNSGLNFFWHQNDDFTITNQGYIWTYPGKELGTKSICVLPETVELKTKIMHCAGICTDYPNKYL